MKYFALESGSALKSLLLEKVTKYDSYLKTSGILADLKRSYRTFFNDTRIRDVGSAGELQAISINQYASLIRAQLSLICSQKTAFQAQASNTDVDTQRATILANALLDFYNRELHLDRIFRDAAEAAAILREAFISVEWDTTLGNALAVDENGLEIKEGDLKLNLFAGPLDVIRDLSVKQHSKHNWFILREYINKFELVAQYPELESEILSISAVSAQSQNQLNNQNRLLNETDSEFIPVYTFFHKKNGVLSQGRMVKFIDSAILLDTPLPYNTIPLVRITDSTKFDDLFGYSKFYELLPIQESINTMASTLLTNNAAFGVQSVVIDRSSGYSLQQMSEGLSVIEINKDSRPPQPLQLTASAPESYNFLNMLISQAQTLVAVPDVLRGQASASSSGASLALQANQSLQFSSTLQHSYTSMCEDVGSLLISILQQYANTERVSNLVGKHNRPMIKSWSGKDLKGVNKITVETGSALSKTLSGKLSIAESLTSNGLITEPQQYLEVLETGNLSPIIEGPLSQLQLMRSENEYLSEGQSVRALITDDHEKHIASHASILASPEVRMNPNSSVVSSTLAHIQEHLELIRSADPGLMAILKQQPLPASQASSASASASIPQAMNPQTPMQAQAAEVNMPQMPIDLLSGEKFKPLV